MSELKAELKRRRLPVSGVKAALISRLEQHEAQLEPTALSRPPQKGQPAGERPPPSSSGVTAAPSSSSPLASLDADDQGTRAEKLERCASQLRLKSANDLRSELSSLRLGSKGRKPDLVARLAEHYVSRDDANGGGGENEEDVGDLPLAPFAPSPPPNSDESAPLSFAGLPRLSETAAIAFRRAFGSASDPNRTPEPTPIQAVAIPTLFRPPNPSAILHAPTGSGKSIAFLLPITEKLWQEVDAGENGGADPNDMGNGIALVLLPTRELAAQMAGVASTLAPPGMVHLVTHPMDLMAFWKKEVDRGEEYEYQRKNKDARHAHGSGTEASKKYKPRMIVGSAKAINVSLFGNKSLPGTPTPKPKGKALLGSTRWLVLDEVDRLLHTKRSRAERTTKRHEKPAAVIAATTARLTRGRCQVIAASATVGRPLRRELTRVLGLHSSECPETLRGKEEGEEARASPESRSQGGERGVHVGREVRIPDTVRNYVMPVDGSTAGSLLTSAAFAAKALFQNKHDFQDSNRRLLLVLTRKCGINVHNAMGALHHFGVRPAPRSLLDVLEADGTDRLVEAHRKVSRVEGVGSAHGRTDARTPRANGIDGADVDGGEGYLLVTHEDNVRGLHLDALDAVIVVGRPEGPDQYTHIAGRTGRAGAKGSVLNIVGYEQAAALASWTKMLGVDFLPVDEREVASVILDD